MYHPFFEPVRLLKVNGKPLSEVVGKGPKMVATKKVSNGKLKKEKLCKKLT